MASPLETRFERYIELTYSEREALRWLERRERQYDAGEIVVAEGEATDVLYVVASGWLHASVRVREGERQILRFFFVGDITTTFSIAWGESAATLTSVSPCTLYELPRDVLGQLFRDHPRLGAMLYAVSASEHVAMADRLTSIGRTDGVTRIATLLLDIRSRLRVTDGGDSNAFELPLTLQDLGDATGLTKTHVSRLLRDLVAKGFIERSGRIIRVHDVDRLARLVNFRDRHGHVATDWLPPTGASRDISHRQAVEG